MADATESPDIRWKQRLQSFRKALARLEAGVKVAGQRELSDLERQGIIKAFEFTHEMAWNTLKDYLEDQGEVGLGGSKNVTRRAFKLGYIDDGEVWMEMIQSRNRSVHSYNEAMAAELAELVIQKYFSAFERFENAFAVLEKESS